jgi:trimethylamine--corrinoid protein Co-methyltransferase
MTRTPPIRPKLRLLEREDCLRIHRATCEILRNTGVRVYSEAARELLRDAGAVLDGDLARIPPSLVEWALASAPEKFNLYQRGSQEVALRLDGEQIYFGPGSDTLHYLDPHTGERRDFKLADVGDCIRVCDALPEIGFVMSVGVPSDVPSEKSYRYQFASMIRNTTKPIVFVCDDLEDIQAIAKMAAAVAGGWENLSRYPNILLYSEPSTPLQHSREAADKLLFCAEHAIPVTHSPAPMMGGTAPVTMAPWRAIPVWPRRPPPGYEDHGQRVRRSGIPVGPRAGRRDGALLRPAGVGLCRAQRQQGGRWPGSS